jgi:hypothetical protein
MSIVDAGCFHRLGFGVVDAGAASAWFERMLGTTPVVGMGQGNTVRAVNEVDGADTTMQWLGACRCCCSGRPMPGGPSRRSSLATG